MRTKSTAFALLALFLCFILFTSLPRGSLFHSVAGNTLSSVYVTPPQTCCILNTSATPVFTVNVMMNLNSTSSINGFDIRLNYSNWYTPSPRHGVVKAVSLDYSNNIFVQDFGSSQVTTQASCIDDVTYGPSGFCATDDGVGGLIHVAQTILAGSLQGAVNSALLFSVTFTVNATGTSVFYFDRANLENPGGTPPNPYFIQVTTGAAVFGNDPLVAFFDYSSTLSPVVLTGVTARFDASSSFRSVGSVPTPLSSPTYKWNFSDGTGIQTVTNPVILHSFPTPGNYTVGLVANDTNPGGGFFQRVVRVVPPLGNIFVSVKNQGGGSIQSIVTVKLYNLTTPRPPLCRTCTQVASAGGFVSFHALSPGTYTLNATGNGVDPGGKVTTVQVGWTTLETLYLTQITSPPPNTIGLEIFAAIIGTGLSLVGVGLYFRWRRNRPLKTGGSVKAVKKRKI